MMDSDELFTFLLNDFPNSCLMTKLLYTALVAITVMVSAITPTAFADSNNIQGEDLKKNPLALDILAPVCGCMDSSQPDLPACCTDRHR